MNSTSTARDNQKQVKQPSLLWNLVFNLALPTVILTKLSSDEYLGIKLAIIVALIFPLGYGLRDLIAAKTVNFFSALGIVSIALTGGISLMELDASYIAIKEAAIPAMLGVATLISLKTSQPLVHTFLLNDAVVDSQLISQALTENHAHQQFEKLLLHASIFLAGSFLLSALLNYILAVVILTAEPGTELFNQQLGKMTALSFPVIALPLTVILAANLMYIFRGITRLTNLSMEQLLTKK